MRGKARLARFAAPAAFLAAATVAILLVRSGLENGDATTPPATTAVTTAPSATQPGTTGGTTTNAAGTEFYVIQAGDTLAVDRGRARHDRRAAARAQSRASIRSR